MGLCLLYAVFVLIMGGCADNPEDRAAKAVHQQIAAALSGADAMAGKQSVQSAVLRHRPTGLAGDSAHLVAGNLGFSHGLSLLAELPLKTVPIHAAADDIAVRLFTSQQRLLEKGRIEKMLALQDAEIVELQTVIAGTSDQPGLELRLAQAKGEMATLAGQKQDIQREKAAVQAVIDGAYARAEALLKQADLAAGDEKLRLQQQAYALRLEHTDEHVKVQAAANSIAILDDQIALVQSQFQSLEENLLQTRSAIEVTERSDSRMILRSQKTEIDQLLSEQQKYIFEQADAIQTGLIDYRQAVDEICDVLLRAAEQYERVRSGGAGLLAAVRAADSYTYSARAAAERMLFGRRLAEKLEGTLAAADETLVRGLAERLPLSMEFDPERFEKIMTLFDQAGSAYERAMILARQAPEHSRETAVRVLNSHLLAVQSKMQIADTLGQYNVATQTQVRLEELREQGREFGSLFTLSETARLLDKGLAYIPTLPVNVELYFEGIRQRFSEWRRLSTPDEQAAAVERNLSEMEELVRAFGDEMERLLEPLRQEMLEARERGFTAPAAPAAAPAVPGIPGEPNSPAMPGPGMPPPFGF